MVLHNVVRVMTCGMLLAGLVRGQSINDFLIMTEEFPPYNYTENGELKGIAVDLLGHLLKEMKANVGVKDVKVYPWSRGYALAQKQKNTMLFSTTRTEERENLFKWVGPITATKVCVITRKSRNIRINGDAELKNYKIGTIADDFAELVLISKGIRKEDITRLTDAKLLMKMLESDRIDVWAYDVNVAKFLLEKNGYDFSQFDASFILKTRDLYFAFQKDTPDEFIQGCQSLLSKVRTAY